MPARKDLDADQIRSLLDDGMTLDEICVELRVSLNCLRRNLRAAGWPSDMRVLMGHHFGPKLTVLERFEAHICPEPNTGCLLWTAFAAGDPGFEYGKFMLYEGTKRDGLLVESLAHRVSWRLYRGPIPEGLWVLHHCDTPPCVEPTHLFLGTALDNKRDCIAKGRDRNASGEENGNARLTADEAEIIRNSPETGAAMAERFGIAQSTVSQIRRGQTWRS
jgi:hypothetical protein